MNNPPDPPPFQVPTGGSGVFITTREIYDALIIVQHHLARIDGQLSGALSLQSTVNELEERVRKIEGWTKAIPPALILTMITIILVVVQMERP